MNFDVAVDKQIFLAKLNDFYQVILRIIYVNFYSIMIFLKMFFIHLSIVEFAMHISLFFAEASNKSNRVRS